MAEAEPTTFKVREPDGQRDGRPDGNVRFEEVRLHRTVETDKAGLSRIHVRLTGQAKAHDEAPFASLTANIAFSLFDKDRLLGILTAHDVTFERNEQTVAVTADDGLYIETSESVTHVEAQIETSKVVRGSAKLAFG